MSLGGNEGGRGLKARLPHGLHSTRVGNVGSLSWFATVYIETHISFTAAYGLTLGFMVIAFVMLVGGRQYYSAGFLRSWILISLADVL